MREKTERRNIISVSIIINNCSDCPYVDHSGSFTPGGAKQICGHSDAAERATKNKEVDFLVDDVYGEKVKAGIHHWIHRVIINDNIPDWCPLK